MQIAGRFAVLLDFPGFLILESTTRVKNPVRARLNVTFNEYRSIELEAKEVKRETSDYLRFVLKTCSEAFVRGEPESFVQDAVRAELFNNFRTLQEHAAPSTRSDLLFKGAVEDTARSVYSGLIHLLPEAQKSRASQTNRRNDSTLISS